jgi:hypothetical protein
MLCPSCKTIFEVSAERDLSDTSTTRSGTLGHWSTLGGLTASAIEGCFLCHTILKRVEKYQIAADAEHDHLQLSYSIAINNRIDACWLAIKNEGEVRHSEIARFRLENGVPGTKRAYEKELNAR